MPKKKTSTQNISFPTNHLTLYLWLMGQDNISQTARDALYLYKAQQEGKEIHLTQEERVEEKLDRILNKLNNIQVVSAGGAVEISTDVEDMKKEFDL